MNDTKPCQSLDRQSAKSEALLLLDLRFTQPAEGLHSPHHPPSFSRIPRHERQDSLARPTKIEEKRLIRPPTQSTTGPQHAPLPVPFSSQLTKSPSKSQPRDSLPCDNFVNSRTPRSQTQDLEERPHINRRSTWEISHRQRLECGLQNACLLLDRLVKISVVT